ncbi:hypothetical protein AB6A40_005422 [Gnathostoma spinigerum]|uniref:Gustatory receptor n=1 Tax=Gnathostoma spinigerum TaxID=75299 RepID=A0ABD6EFE8_9BILA
MPSISVLSTGVQKPSQLITDPESGFSGGSSSCCDDFIHRKKRINMMAVKNFAMSQVIYAHYVKLLTLFIIAVVHAIYMNSFLTSFTALAEYVRELGSQTIKSDTFVLHRELNILIDYKKNMWMSVASMCVSLSTSCFFLIMALPSQRAAYVVIMRIVDLMAFSSLPAILVARYILVQSIHIHLPGALMLANSIKSADELTDSLGCSVLIRENIPLCSDVILKSIFPTVIIEYLVILSIMTIAYLLLAYLIYYCIRHWFPPSHQHTYQHSYTSCTPSERTARHLVL